MNFSKTVKITRSTFDTRGRTIFIHFGRFSDTKHSNDAHYDSYLDTSCGRHTQHTQVLSLITWGSALLDLLHFTFFLDCPLSQASYKTKSFQRRIALVRLPLLPGQYVTSFTNKTRPELELTYGPRPLTGTALRAAPRWCVVCIPQQNGGPTRRAVKNFAVQGCTAPPPTHTPLIKRHAHSGQGAVHTDFLVSSGLMSGEEQDESLSEKPSEKERESEDAGHDPS